MGGPGRIVLGWALLGCLAAGSPAAGEPYPPEPGSEEIRKYAVDDQQGPQRNFGVQPIHDNRPFAIFRADRLEHRWTGSEERSLLWDMQGWIGTDYDKLYFESEGHASLEDGWRTEEAGLELLYSRTVGRFWDVQVGLAQDFDPDPERTHLAFGVQGLAPYWFEVDATAYLSEDGDLSARIELEYEILVTQRLGLIPRLETGLSLQDLPEYGQWQGFTRVTLGLRMRYQIRRELSPYAGLTWTRFLGETGHNIRLQGGDVDTGALVAGLRFWF